MVEVIAPHQNPHKVKLWTNDLAQIVGLKSKGSIGQFETGLNVPSADILVALQTTLMFRLIISLADRTNQK
jgi:hypothetical protein